MIKVIQGFKLSTRDAVDNRLLLTKEQMRNIDDNQMPERYFAICSDDGLLYTYDKNSIVETPEEGEDLGTGKFKQYANDDITVVERGYYYDGVFYKDKDHKITIIGYSYKLYLDLDTFKLYVYNDELKYKCINELPDANSSTAGIMKLYGETGSNEDGTMTQSSITTELNKKFTVRAEDDENLIFTNGVLIGV